jgi:hypothetical protein
MDRYITQENIRHFRDRLSREVNPGTRTLLQKLLVEEENKLGADLEALADVQQYLEDGHHRIERQRALVAIMEREGHKGLDQAKVLLDSLLQTQFLHRYHYQRLLIKINQASPIR